MCPTVEFWTSITQEACMRFDRNIEKCGMDWAHQNLMGLFQGIVSKAASNHPLLNLKSQKRPATEFATEASLMCVYIYMHVWRASPVN